MEDRLRKFAAICDAGSFTKAALELHISQPALSAAIRTLERELGTGLLVHGVRPLTLTPAGTITYDTAKSLAVSTANLQHKLAELAQSAVHFRIGLIDSIADSLFSDAGVFASLGQRTQLSITVHNSRTLLQATERGDLDIAFVANPPTAPSGTIGLQHIANEPLVAVCARSISHAPAY
jgi:DNA-binding transcriptional LysR family regulator